MIIMFNAYFELASNNKTGESIAFVVAEITFNMAVMTSSVAKISFYGRYPLFGGWDSF